jgi:hypothetical protein
MKGSVDAAQTITTYLNRRRGSMLVGGMNPLRGLGKADASNEAMLTNHCLQFVLDTRSVTRSRRSFSPT